jgi:hypothetical protein
MLVSFPRVCEREFPTAGDPREIRVGEEWALEGRGGIWHDLGSEFDTAYRLFLVYVGAVYSC